VVLVLPLLSCGNSADNEMLATAATPGTQLIGRFVTPELWAGQATATNTRSPATGGGPVVLGPIEMRHPIDGHLILAYERVVHLESGRKRQLLTVTQDGAGLGRVLDSRAGQPERRFAGDVIFPLGVWRQGEMREFKATEHTLLGPALRQITLEIMDVDHIHNGVANSLRYRLTIRDEARRVLDCEVSVYSPGLGLVAFEASSYWQGCNTCPCPG
jgi:hypothetical protein